MHMRTNDQPWLLWDARIPGVRVAVALALAMLAGATAKASTPCTPCGDTVRWSEEKDSDVGFLCQEGFPATPLEHPYTCLVFFEVPATHNLTFHFHEIYTRDVSLVVCNSTYHENRRYLPDLAYWKINCKALQLEQGNARLLLHGNVYLNVTSLREARRDDHRLHHDKYSGRHGFNFTYEIWRRSEKPVVEDLQYGNLHDCNYNGIPILHQASGKYRFACQCPAGVSGPHCQWGGACVKEHAERLCSFHGACRNVAGVSACNCEWNYFGATCQFHFTNIPTQSRTCQGRKDCQQNCHLRVARNQTYTYCSCGIGYTVVNETRCRATEEWVVAATMKIGRGRHLSKEKIRNQTLELLNRGDSGGKADKQIMNISINKKVEVEVSLTGKSFMERISKSELWHRTFHTRNVNVSAIPRLSVGPVSAEFPDKQKLVLRCPVYGGPDLRVTWYKDGILIYAHAVSWCYYEDSTALLYVKAEPGSVKYKCTLMLQISPLEQMDRGTYACQVIDRHDTLTRMVVVGVNESLQAELTPFVHSVLPGSSTTVNCTTKNRGWVDGDHYGAEWTVLPQDGYSSYQKDVVFRSGFRLHIVNITKPLNVTCHIKEKEGVIYMPGEEALDEAWDTAEVHVLEPGRPACRAVTQDRVTWGPISVGTLDEQRCPPGHRGRAVRLCSPLPTPPPLPPTWETPDFSDCFYEPLVNIRTLLTLYKRGYKTLSGSVDKQARDFSRILQERRTPILPGERASLWQILEMLQDAGKKMGSLISHKLFFEIVHEIIKDYDSFTLMDVCRMNEPIRTYLKSGLNATKPEGQVTRLPHLLAKREVITGHQMFEMEGSEPRTDSSQGAPTVQVSLEETDVLETHAVTQLRRQASVPDVSLAVGVVTYLNPGLVFDYDWEVREGPFKLAGYLVEIVWGLSASSDKNLTSSQVHSLRAGDTHKVHGFSSVSRLHYPICPRVKNWHLKCGQPRHNDTDIQWDFGMCSVDSEGRGSEAGCVCRCRGEGLFGLVIVNGTDEGVTEGAPEPTWQKNYVTGVGCCTSFLLLLLCLLLQLPRSCAAAVQLRAVKCAALAGVNGVFAALALWQVDKSDYLTVLVAAGVCFVLCFAAGVSQQMLLHHRLSLSPHDAGLPPTCVSNIMIFSLTMVVGLLIWVVHSVTQYQLGTPWLTLGPAWPLTALLVGILAALSLLWVIVAGHNLYQLTVLQEESSHYVLVRDRLWHQVLLLVGEWVLVITSALYNHPVGRYFFCCATVVQSFLMIIMYTCKNEDVNAKCRCKRTCCPPVGHCRKSSQSENGSSHMSYHLTTTTTPSEREGNFKYFRDDVAADSLEKDLFTAKKVPPGPGHPRLGSQSRVPLYMRRNSRDGHHLQIPRNTLLIRGVDLLRGEEDKAPQDNRLRASMSAEEILSHRKKKILLSAPHATKRDPTLEMLRIQRCPGTSQDPDGRYLDMSVPQHKLAGEGLRQDALNKHSCMAINKETSGSAGNSSVHKQNGFRQTAIAHKNIYQNNNRQSSKEETDSSAHHYLPMKVNSHVILAKHRALEKQTEPNISVHAEYMMSDHCSSAILQKVPRP
ncbi:uncharacterized protein LOC122254133 isoform X2 [Penaeus japonicus]|uniref:uncharacterized protein LOC122254133 isoform X2 n=1 Tax=Penaeus japonicus TaxID=27405 RepID=UPI001C70E324|nr:uncharacterized protein LOC122254133 isoform X2 [Penaeus japonicus]